MDSPPNQDPAAGQLEDSSATPDAEGGGYTICIACKPDGSFTVYKEGADEETQEAGSGEQPAGAPGDQAGATPPAGGMAQPEGKTVDSLEEALKAVIRLHQLNPMDHSYSANMSAGFQGENTKPY